MQLSKGVDGTLDLTAEEFFVLRAYLILLFGNIPAISKLLIVIVSVVCDYFTR